MSGLFVGRGRQGFVARSLGLLAVLVVSLASSVACVAGAHAVQLTHDMPVRPHALSKADFDAIVAEARDIAQLTSETRDVSHWPTQWKSLDRAKLAALWSMPESATLDEPARIVLVEQAAVWDMLAFDRPSEAAILWEKLWPRSPGSRPDAAPNGSGIALIPDANWSDNAVAMVSVFSCFPTIAWTAPSDPAVWATTHSNAWNWWNSSDWNALRDCIRETVGNRYEPARDGPASVRRSDAVIAILKAKFLHELSKDRCTRQGPDSCLLIYQALYALDRTEPRLVPILHAMEPSFDLDRPMALPTLDDDGGDGSVADAARKSGATQSVAMAPARKKRRTDDVPETDRKLLEATLAEIERRKIFITLKLPVLIGHPEAWRPGELDRTLRQAMELTLAVDRLHWTQGLRFQEFDRYFSDPWQWVDGSSDGAINASLRGIGASVASRVGCDTDGLGLGTRIPAFWQGNAIELIRSGRVTANCRAVYSLRLPVVYQAAVQQRDATVAARDIAVFAPIEAALTREGDTRTQALDAMTATCAARKDPSARDPWKLCAGVAARDAAKAELEQKQAAAEAERVAAIKAAQPPPDPYACGDGVVVLAARALGYKGDADFWNSEQTACRLRPENLKEAIVALTYTHGDQLSGHASDNNDSGYDLDVLVVRTDDGTLVARNAHGAQVDSDAVVFEGISIDTANYALAPGQRAFGVRITHDSHCYRCNFGQTALTLYLQHGRKLDAIFDSIVHETRGEWGSTDCDDQPSEMTRTLKVASTASHGLADIELTTTTRSTLDEDAPTTCKTDAAASVALAKLGFDGKSYPLPPGIDAP